jgi:hypothetical protein
MTAERRTPTEEANMAKSEKVAKLGIQRDNN